MNFKQLERIEDLTALRDQLRARQRPDVAQIRLCMTGCKALGAEDVCEAFRKEIAAQGLQEKAVLVDTGCQGFCALAPVVTVAPPGVFYGKVQPEDVKEIIARTVLRGEIVERLACKRDGQPAGKAEEVPFFSKQLKVVLRNCGEIDPLDVGQYIARDGYQAIARVLQTMTPEQVIDAMIKSGLRGRGGAGFPTGMKWKFAREAKGTPKYLICNGDEGDPGAFMDRAVLEGDPHSVIEGMLIGAYAIGAEHGYAYVRAEYPIAVRHMRLSVERLREMGLLGKNILGSGLNFDLEIKEGAGAFVCGEETAMIASIEGKRGNPRPRPPFPAQSGLWGKPTTINNVETLANIAPISLKGWEWFASLGTEKSKGTKVFALAGKVRNTGLVEVPMGATLRDIVFDIGGGIPRGRKFKAAQTGGPSGGCVPTRYLDLPLDYESLKQIGAIMGSGGLIIMDEGTCMVDMARYFLEFTQKESCGKCTPCRIGTLRMLEILTRICNGQGRQGDIETLEDIAKTVQTASLCALGKTAPNPVLSTLKYFRKEYEEHIREHRCRAAVCEAMVKAPCEHLCPAGINVPQYVWLVGLKKYQRAVDLIRRRNPFASICGRVCHHPCELLCRRGELDEPIAIMHLKRIATDLGSKGEAAMIKQLKASPTGKKVAIIGAGPAGLSAGYFLSLMGHRATVYESGPQAGGMMRAGIPEFRLPNSVLDAEIEFIRKSGVNILTDSPMDAKLFAELRKKFDAIFIAVGSHFGTGLGSPEESAGVLEGFDFLRRVKAGEKVPVGRRVVVITGCLCPRATWCDTGGTTAVDSARTALRLGASEVTVLYRRNRDEMPGMPSEVEEALEEGVKFAFLTGPKKVNRNGRVESVECVRFKLGPVDDSGLRKADQIEGSEFVIPADTVIRAAGQKKSAYEFLTGSGVSLSKWLLLETAPHSLMTNTPGVFAGGDCITGHGTVVEAVGHGQRAAVEIDRYLGGKGELPFNSDPLVAGLAPTHEEGLEGRPRAKTPRLDVAQRAKDFSEVDLCFDKKIAACEARRCLRCDLEEYAPEKV
ncbi:MAG: NADH-quinone oxidoreductase subunit NuoF [Verrucomicrobia bacterium]|nr:NADH-quinone oxidoreductase subunit NuoF [Verrucomicrobiota bacterium]